MSTEEGQEGGKYSEYFLDTGDRGSFLWSARSENYTDYLPPSRSPLFLNLGRII